MFKYSDLDYNKFYSSPHCERENKSIKNILKYELSGCKSVLDLGAGTGLVSALIGNDRHIIQIEKDANMKAQNNYPNFIVSDAFDYLVRCRDRSSDAVVSLFALNYMPHGTFTEALRVADKVCVFVIYDKPYLDGSDSFYAGNRWMFLQKCLIRGILLKHEINAVDKRIWNVRKFNLLGEPYYKVILLGRIV